MNSDAEILEAFEVPQNNDGSWLVVWGGGLAGEGHKIRPLLCPADQSAGILRGKRIEGGKFAVSCVLDRFEKRQCSGIPMQLSKFLQVVNQVRLYLLFT